MVLLLHAQQHNKTEDVMFSCHYKIRGKTSYIECTIGRNNKHLTCNRFSNKINTIIYKTVVSIGIISSCFLIGVASLDETIEDGITTGYGADISFPMTHSTVSTNYEWLPHNKNPKQNPTPERYLNMPLQPLSDRQKAYNDFLQGCRDYSDKQWKRCDSNEEDRITNNRIQPAGMQNFTELGFQKIRCPESVFKPLKAFWDENKEKVTEEDWAVGNTFTNNWEAPSYMVDIAGSSLRGGGAHLTKKIWEMAQSTIEEWTGEQLIPCSIYGIRVYTEGAILSPHVDRLPLVSSAIVNVAQDVDEPWPVEVIGHDGNAYNITMEPGEMVLYESHSVIHGRPFPLKGKFFANVFIHFEPKGHINDDDVEEPRDDDAENQIGGYESDDRDGLPPYIILGSAAEKEWREENEEEDDYDMDNESEVTFETGSTEAHHAAQDGDIKALLKISETDPGFLTKKDVLGWEPIHEGSRGGHTEVVQLLVALGANPDEVTSNGTGGTALYWAEESNGSNHPVVEYLRSIGALNIGPEL